MQWTKEQENVIKAGGTDLLVAAGAGSGKTAVLVERIIQKLLDKRSPVSIDRFLVVTFTNAAANQMKQRIIRAIEERLSKEPDNEWLKTQLTLVNSAMITTIDSFCKYVYMNYFNDIGADPSLKIADEVEADMIRLDVLKEIIEEAYRRGDEEFLSFAKNYSGAKKTDEFSDYIYELHKKASSMVDPYMWIKELPLLYDSGELDILVFRHCIDMAGYAGELARELDGWLTESGNDGLKYADNVRADMELIDGICAAGDMTQLKELLIEKFSRLATIKGVDEQVKAVVKNKRDKYKEIIDKIRKDYFSYSEKTYEMLKEAEYKNVSVLSELTLDFMKRYDEKKLEAGLMDFSDLSHFVLDIVWDKENNCPKAAAKEMADFYHEIMIDEYQDSNDVQERILTAVSGMYEGRNNIFMVGDVKQSIYRFRMAKPELFNEKYSAYAPYDDGEPVSGVRGRVIDLHENFRSADHCIDLVNDIFSKIMRKEVGGIDYDDRAALIFGAKKLNETDINGVPADKEKLKNEIEIFIGNEDMNYDREQAEALMICARIKKLMEEDVYITENSGDGIVRRKLRYGDIVILLRKLKGYSDVFSEVFEKNGIPLETESSTGYFDTPEIRTLLDALRVIDNPYQDIALAGVLSSSVIGMEAGELAELRAKYPDCHLYEGIFKYINESCDTPLYEKCMEFISFHERYKKKSGYKTIGELISDIVSETGYYDQVCALGSGEKRRANIDALINKASGLSEKSSRSLHSFIATIEKMKKYEKSFEPPALVSENDAVRIMTIHKSKGLEFPVVFVSGCMTDINLMDTRDRLLIDPKLGISLQNRDYDKRLKYNDRSRKLMAYNIREDCIGEELRILYVALTRAKEKLIITGCDILDDEFDEQEYLDGYSMPASGERLNVIEILKSKRYMDFILKALMPEHMDMVTFHTPEDIEESVTEAEKERISDYLDINRIKEMTASVKGGPYYDTLKEQRDFRYPYTAAVLTRAKSSVSQIKHEYMKDEEYQGYISKEKADEPVLEPEFIKKEREAGKTAAADGAADEKAAKEGGTAAYEIGAADRGTIYHSIMEHLRLDPKPDLADIEAQVKKMRADGFLPEGFETVIDLKKIERFVESEYGRKACDAYKAGKLYRERQFYLNLEDEVSKEPVVVQGVIDAYWTQEDPADKEDVIILLDYKTDRVKDHNAGKVFKDRYEKQLEIYEEALKRVSGQKVKKRIIYSFELDKAFEI